MVYLVITFQFLVVSVEAMVIVGIEQVFLVSPRFGGDFFGIAGSHVEFSVLHVICLLSPCHGSFDIGVIDTSGRDC
jgi:hypothetical protein